MKKQTTLTPAERRALSRILWQAITPHPITTIPRHTSAKPTCAMAHKMIKLIAEDTEYVTAITLEARV